MKILLVEDDKVLGNGILLALKDSEKEIDLCHNLATARLKIQNDDFDLMILDINLPDGNGLDMLREIKMKKNLPVILLTANDMETDVVMGLELGADDYITKPFSLAVLRARVNTQLRKRDRMASLSIVVDDLSLDFERLIFKKDKTEFELSKIELKLLRMLIEHKGHILERRILIDRLWTDGDYFVDENALSVTIKRLRDKLEDQPSNPKYIKTVYGIGYTWAVK